MLPAGVPWCAARSAPAGLRMPHLAAQGSRRPGALVNDRSGPARTPAAASAAGAPGAAPVRRAQLAVAAAAVAAAARATAAALDARAAWWYLNSDCR